ncbi:MAG: MarR family transcriptional regulator [Umezawaea sp.]
MDRMADESPPTRLRTMASWLMTQIAVGADRLVGERLATADTRRHHYRVLAALDEFGPSSQAEVARNCGVHSSDVVAVVTELVGKGLVDRSPDPADRRRNTITITAVGVGKLRELDALLADVQDELLASLSPGERDELVRLLGRVLEHQRRS